MDIKLPKNSVLIALGYAVVVSVICTWNLVIHFEARNQKEFDRIYERLVTIEKMLPLIGEDR